MPAQNNLPRASRVGAIFHLTKATTMQPHGEKSSSRSGRRSVYLSLVEDDRADKAPSASGHFAAMDEILQFPDLDGALKSMGGKGIHYLHWHEVGC